VSLQQCPLTGFLVDKSNNAKTFNSSFAPSFFMECRPNRHLKRIATEFLWSCHFLYGDMNPAIARDPIFGIGRRVDEYKTAIASIPNQNPKPLGASVPSKIEVLNPLLDKYETPCFLATLRICLKRF